MSQLGKLDIAQKNRIGEQLVLRKPSEYSLLKPKVVRQNSKEF